MTGSEAPFGLADLFALRVVPNPYRKTVGFARASVDVRCRWPEIMIDNARERRVRLAELRLEPEMHTCLVANLDHLPQRFAESGVDSANYRILGLVREVRRIEIAEVVILDAVVERATG